MAIKRMTLSVPESLARRIKSAAGAGPVSAWVTNLLEDHLDDAALKRQWLEFCRDVCPGHADVRRAEAMLKRLTGARKRRAA